MIGVDEEIKRAKADLREVENRVEYLKAYLAGLEFAIRLDEGYTEKHNCSEWNDGTKKTIYPHGDNSSSMGSHRSQTRSSRDVE